MHSHASPPRRLMTGVLPARIEGAWSGILSVLWLGEHYRQAHINSVGPDTIVMQQPPPPSHLRVQTDTSTVLYPRKYSSGEHVKSFRPREPSHGSTLYSVSLFSSKELGVVITFYNFPISSGLLPWGGNDGTTRPALRWI